MGEPSRVRALTREIAALRAELEQYRTELREVLDRFLDESACSTQDGLGGCTCSGSGSGVGTAIGLTIVVSDRSSDCGGEHD